MVISDEKQDELVEVGKSQLPNGCTITFVCSTTGPTLDAVMQDVYSLVAQSIIRRVNSGN